MRRPFALERRAVLLGVAAALFSSVAFAKNHLRNKAGQASARSMRTSRNLIRNSERKGGHFNTKHVNKSRRYLKRRARRDMERARATRSASRRKQNPQRASKNQALQNARRAKQTKVRKRNFDRSSFSSKRQAELALARAIDMNRSKMRKWMKGGARSPLTIYTPLASGGGTIYRGRTGEFVRARSAQFVLRRDGKRFLLFTGYPSNRVFKK